MNEREGIRRCGARVHGGRGFTIGNNHGVSSVQNECQRESGECDKQAESKTLAGIGGAVAVGCRRNNRLQQLRNERKQAGAGGDHAEKGRGLTNGPSGFVGRRITKVFPQQVGLVITQCIAGLNKPIR